MESGRIPVGLLRKATEMASTGRRARGAEDTELILRAMRGELTSREMAMIGFAPDTKAVIIRVIELSPVLEEAVLEIADLCYRDGLDAT